MADAPTTTSGAAARPVPRVVVLGNCQVSGVAACLQQRRPGWAISSVFVGEIGSPDEARALNRTLGDYDVVVAQPVTRAALFPLHLDRIRSRARRLVTFPRVVYTGLHPDAIKLNRGAELIASPTGALGSKITAAGFRLGLPPARTRRMFNAYVYARLGYFDEPARADQFQIRLGREVGMEMADMLARWRGQGVFMHHPLHPKIAVADGLAVLALRQLGEDEGPDAGLPPDPLAADNVWPVLPELARRLGVEGSTCFRTKAGETLSLDEFIDRSYRIYAEAGLDGLDDPALAQAAEVLAAEIGTPVRR